MPSFQRHYKNASKLIFLRYKFTSVKDHKIWEISNIFWKISTDGSAVAKETKWFRKLEWGGRDWAQGEYYKCHRSSSHPHFQSGSPFAANIITFAK